MPFEEPSESARLRALSHPLRLRILELLAAEGPLTATAVGERLGSSPSNCSFHLRLLHRAGFIEEAPDAAGRNRPWRLVEENRQVTVTVDDLDDAGRQQLRQSVSAGTEQLRNRAFHWLDIRDRFSDQVRDATGMRNSVVFLTPDELTALDQAITGLLTPYEQRGTTDVPHDAIAIALGISALPIDDPPGTD